MTEYWKDTTTPLLPGEEWKDIPDIENYQCSNLGRIKSLDRYAPKGDTIRFYKGVIRKQNVDKKKYLNTMLNYKRYRVHNLVALTFFGTRPEGYQCDHIDANRQNNQVSNLRYVTCKENVHNPISMERHLKAMSVLWEKRKKPILQYSLNGDFIRRWDCIKDAAISLNIKHNAITFCLSGKGKTSGGYQWRYESNDKPTPQKINANTPYIRPIIQSTLDGVMVKKWDSLSDITRELGINQSSIAYCCKGLKSYRTAGGFKWSYA